MGAISGKDLDITYRKMLESQEVEIQTAMYVSAPVESFGQPLGRSFNFAWK